MSILTPLQREVEPPPDCSRCGRAITTLSGLYRCAQCHAPFDWSCIQQHFGWGVNPRPHDTEAAHTDADGLSYQVEGVIAADLLHAEAMLEQAHVALKRGTETLAAALRAALADRASTPEPTSSEEEAE